MPHADAALLLTYGAVAIYFVNRFVRFRRWPSLGVASLPLGWVLLALEHDVASWLEPLKWIGVGAGLLLLALVLNADRTESR